MALLRILSLATMLAALEARPIRDAANAADAAIELNSSNFNQTMWSAPASFVLLEFYASWCPACRNYKAHYERIAKLFNGRNAPYPGVIFVARADCANQINSELCDRFSVDHFPTLYWGAPGKIARGTYSREKSNEIEQIQNLPRNAQGLVEWINKRIGKHYRLDDGAPIIQSQGSVSVQSMLSLQDIEEATTLSYNYILQDKMLNAESLAQFLSFLQLLAVHHPSRRCRKGSADILVNYEDVWLSSTPNYDLLRRLPICSDRKYGGWKTCHGSVNGTRGYSCGLWLLFHSLSVRVDDAESRTALQTIRNFVGNFFRCEECRNHFMEMSRSAVNAVSSRSDLVLWLWQAHNKVNARVGKQEAELNTGDPQYPKQQWPSREMCRSCRLSSDEQAWNETAVYAFLLEYYGRGMNTELEVLDAAMAQEQQQQEKKKVDALVPEDMTSSGVTVPVGAAFGVAMASCGFGLVACYWRTQQKRRKLLRRRV